MAHLTKLNRGQVGAVIRHCERLNENYSNENINQELTKENTYFVNGNCKNGQEYLSKRLSQLKVLNRKDVNVACSWVITIPKDLPEEYGSDFFSYTFKFLAERYKPENCISASLHLDEVTPHLHYIFVPEINGKVCAKEVINRKELKVFHKELKSYLEDKMHVKVNILNNATKNGNKTVEQLKGEEKVKQLEKQLDNDVKLAELRLQIQERNPQVKLYNENKKLNQEVKALERQLHNAEKFIKEIGKYKIYLKHVKKREKTFER